MPAHPESQEDVNELIEWIEKQEVVDVWCKKCEVFVKMNAVYAPYLDGEIERCGACRLDK